MCPRFTYSFIPSIAQGLHLTSNFKKKRKYHRLWKWIGFKSNLNFIRFIDKHLEKNSCVDSTLGIDSFSFRHLESESESTPSFLRCPGRPRAGAGILALKSFVHSRESETSGPEREQWGFLKRFKWIKTGFGGREESFERRDVQEEDLCSFRKSRAEFSVFYLIIPTNIFSFTVQLLFIVDFLDLKWVLKMHEFLHFL